MAFQYQWRVKARVVAYLSLIATVIGAFLYAILCVGVLTNSIKKDSVLQQLDVYGFKLKPDDAQWTIYARAVFVTVLTILYLWTSVLLLRATKVGADPVQGLAWTNFWLILVVLDSVLWIIGMIYNWFLVSQPKKSNVETFQNIFTYIFFVVIMGVLLFIVLSFARELKQAARGNLPTIVACKL